MSAPIICGIIVVLTIIVILIIMFNGSGDSESELAMKSINICRQKEEHPIRDYIVDNYLNDLRLNDNYTDITIVSKNLELRAHKVILAAHSKYFDLMFWSKNQSDRFEIPDHIANDKAILHALQFIYSSALPSELFDNENEYGDLLLAANEFQMDSLKCEMSKRLSIRINVKNVAQIVAVSEKSDAKFLLNVASYYLLEHFDEVRRTSEWKTVAKNNKNILTNAIDFHGKLSKNSKCDIECEIATPSTPSISANLRRFFITQRFADAEIHMNYKIDNKVFRVNRAILIAQSPLFREQFAVSPESIEISDTRSAVMEEFLIYMYSGWPSQLKKFAEGLLYLSNQYEMQPLKNTCEDVLIDELNIQNAGKIVEIANKANSTRLSSIVLDFIVANRKDIVATKAWAELKEKDPQLLTKLFFN